MIDQPGADARAFAGRPDTRGPPLDTSALLQQCMGNAELVVMLVDKFEKQACEDIARIEQAIATRDVGQTTRVSHALKGAAGALSAIDVQRTAADIELSARENRLESAAECFNELKAEVDRCLAYLPTVRAVANGAARTSTPEPERIP